VAVQRLAVKLRYNVDLPKTAVEAIAERGASAISAVLLDAKAVTKRAGLREKFLAMAQYDAKVRRLIPSIF
jgi:hypothetical protein